MILLYSYLKLLFRIYDITRFLIYGDDEMEADDYVSLYNAITGADMTNEEFNEYVK